CLKLSPLSRETNSPSSVPMKIAPGAFGFVTMVLILIGVSVSPAPALPSALGNLISLQPFFSSSVRNNPSQVEAIIQDGWGGWGRESPSPALTVLFVVVNGVSGNIAKT